MPFNYFRISRVSFFKTRKLTYMTVLNTINIMISFHDDACWMFTVLYEVM